MASNMGENRLTSDLKELKTAMDEPMDELTLNAVFLAAIGLMKARCGEAAEALEGSRTLYDADQTENKIASLTYAEDIGAAVEEAEILEEALRAKLLGGRAGRSLKEGEKLAREQWLDGIFVRRPSWWVNASQNDSLDALTKIVGRMRDAKSLATQDEYANFAEAVEKVESSYAVLVSERQDDTPLSNALKAARVNAVAQRSAGRHMLQCVLDSERIDMSLAQFLKRRAKPKAKDQDPSAPPAAGAPTSTPDA